jgi:putative inorganic carbon (HCO3(-)) transporter
MAAALLSCFFAFPDWMMRVQIDAGHEGNEMPRVQIDADQQPEKAMHGTLDPSQKMLEAAQDAPPPYTVQFLRNLTPFWHDRLVETALILSMACYYLFGNSNLGNSWLFHLNPLVSLPFLLIFIALSWYRLSFALTLLPLTLPYYLLQKPVYSHYEFSLAEIALLICLGLALLQLLLPRANGGSSFSWQGLRTYLGPFALPALIFLLSALVATAFAVDRHTALRSLRETVIEPILYLVLLLIYARSRQHITRLLAAILGTGALVALLGIAQYLLDRNQLLGTARISAVYSGANDIGVLFDYVLPFGLALLLIGVWRGPAFLRTWGVRIGAFALCVLLLVTLYLSQSGGGEVAIALAFLFICAFSIRSRKLLLTGAGVLLLAAAGAVLVLHTQILKLILDHHANSQGISTVMRRIYLWESAVHMIRDHFVLGVGPDNWLCYYSNNTLCTLPVKHYWILHDPVTHAATGMNEEPNLAQPHNDLLNIWLSIGLFGLLAFLALVALVFWCFVRILANLRFAAAEDQSSLYWMVVGLGAALVATLAQSMVDSVFLGQDTAFLFWSLIALTLLLRLFSGTLWRGRIIR